MELKTKNLIIRTVTYDDLNEVARMWNFEKGEISLEEAEKAINWMKKNHEQNKLHKIVHICFAIFESNKNRIIGWCGLDGRNSDNENKNTVDIFYLIDKDYRRRGYATECAKKVLEYGFTKMGISKIDGKCDINNIGSQKILEKIGMKKISMEQVENKEDLSLHYFMTFTDYTGIYNR